MIPLPRLSGRSVLLALCGLAAFGSAGALAVPRSVGECESLKNDLAYNQCLAMFGPEARNVGGGDGGGSGGPAMAAASAGASANAAIPTTEEPVVETRRGRRGRYGRRHGRQVAAFAIASEDGSSTRSHRRRRRH